MGRWARSWQLMKASFDVLLHERKLLIFPAISGACLLLVLASFALPVIYTVGMHTPADQLQAQFVANRIGWYVLLFAFYTVTYSVAFFFNTALVIAALEHLEGGHPTVGDCLRQAWAKWPQILGFALISATVGLILRALEERLGIIGQIVVSLIGMAWSVTTFLVVPTLAATDVGPVDALKGSAKMLKDTWGENLIGNAGLGIFGLLLGIAWAIVLAIVIALVVATGSVAILVLGGLVVALAMIFIVLVQSALHGIYSAALYRFATAGEAGGQFDVALLEKAFRTRRKRRRF